MSTAGPRKPLPSSTVAVAMGMYLRELCGTPKQMIGIHMSEPISRKRRVEGAFSY